MLILIFYVGNDRYALDSSQVIEIIPKIILRKQHHAPEYIAGLCNYRGKIVPVIDLCQLIQGLPCSSALSSRIIMVNYLGIDHSTHLVGLMAQRVTETLNKQKTDLVATGLEVSEAPYLGEMIMDEQGMIQSIRLEYLLSDTQQAYLLPASEN
ncbi:MAG: chemotaxis protein CheW [Symploca sp. SIO2G7]|nr:chemotaxis protein CheW [Symploca sp. SIO2G7]